MAGGRDRVLAALATSGGLGLAPFAPGTFGTLGGVAIAWAGELVLAQPWSIVTAAILAAVLLAVGCAMTAFVERHFHAKDPGAFVLDEVVGYLVTYAIFVAVTGSGGWLTHLLCFMSFRVFDIAKLWPARRLEAVAGAPGIMLDDVAAGVQAGLVLVLAMRLVPV